MDYFCKIIDDDIMNCFVIETNRYARQWIANPDLLAKPCCRVRNWKPVTKEEMYKFLALILLMGIHVVKKPNIELYWSRDPLYHTPLFSAIMARDRFKIILKFFHFVDNKDAPAANDPHRDRLFKVRPIVDDLNEKLKKFYTPSQDLVHDESLMLWKGRFLFHQYLPARKSRFGVKIYNLCENSGYTYRFRIYTGA